MSSDPGGWPAYGRGIYFDHEETRREEERWERIARDLACPLCGNSYEGWSGVVWGPCDAPLGFRAPVLRCPRCEAKARALEEPDGTWSVRRGGRKLELLAMKPRKITIATVMFVVVVIALGMTSLRFTLRELPLNWFPRPQSLQASRRDRAQPHINFALAQSTPSWSWLRSQLLRAAYDHPGLHSADWLTDPASSSAWQRSLDRLN